MLTAGESIDQVLRYALRRVVEYDLLSMRAELRGRPLGWSGVGAKELDVDLTS